MIVGITILSILIGYSIALVVSIQLMWRKRRAASRIAMESQSSDSPGNERIVAIADPYWTVGTIVLWTGLVLFFAGVFSLAYLDDPFTSETLNFSIVGIAVFLLITLLFIFRSIASGGQEIVIFSERGITVMGVITGSELALPWHDIDEFTYAIGEFGFSSYILTTGKRNIFIGNSSDGDKTILKLIVKHVPPSMWKKDDLKKYLAEHFGIVIEENP